MRAWLGEQAQARADLFDFDFALVALRVQRDGDLGRFTEQRPNFLLRAAQRIVFQRSGQREEEKQNRPFTPRADAGRAGSDGEHQKVNVNRALAKSF